MITDCQRSRDYEGSEMPSVVERTHDESHRVKATRLRPVKQVQKQYSECLGMCRLLVGQISESLNLNSKCALVSVSGQLFFHDDPTDEKV